IPLPRRPGRLPRPTLRAPQPIRGPRDPVSQIARTMSRVVEHFIHAAIVVLLAFGDALLLLLHWLSVLVVGWINWLLGWTVSLVLVLFDALRLFVPAARTATRVVIVPIAGVVVGALCVASFAHAALRYLTAGDLTDVPALLGYGVAGACALTVVW